MSDEKVVWVNFGKKDDFFDEGRPTYSIKITVQSPRWWPRFRERLSRLSITKVLPEA